MGCRNSKIIPKLEMDQKVHDVVEKFCLTQSEIRKLWHIYHVIDTDDSGTVSVVEIFRLIKERPNSVIAPYLIEYISDLEKEQGDRLSFVEFVRSIAKYCLLTPPQILKFVFQCIDENRNGTINKEEIMLFLRAERDGKMIFPNNYMKAVELFETQRSDSISWLEFVRLVREVPYLGYPAFRLQTQLRIYTLGTITWSNIARRLIKRKKDEIKKAEEDAIQNQMMQEKIWDMQIKAWDYNDKLAEFEKTFNRKMIRRRTKRLRTSHV